MKNLFIELIQVSLLKRTLLSQTPSTTDWYQFFELAEKHTIIGICFCGLQKLPVEQAMYLPLNLKLHWIALAMSIQANNNLANQRCLELQHKLNVSIRLRTTIQAAGE